MATLLADNQAKISAGTKDNNWIEQGKIKTSLKVMTDTYFCNPALNGDRIAIATPPKGARIAFIQLGANGLGAGVLLEVGDATNIPRYLSAWDATATGMNNSMNAEMLQHQIGTEVGDEQILITVSGADATGNIWVSVYYTN